MALTKHTIQEKPPNICGNTHKETVLSRGQAVSYLGSQTCRQQECPTKWQGHPPLLHALPLWGLPKAPAQPELPSGFHQPGPSSPVARAMYPHMSAPTAHAGQEGVLQGGSRSYTHPRAGRTQVRKEESESPARHTLSNTSSLEINQPLFCIYRPLMLQDLPLEPS